MSDESGMLDLAYRRGYVLGVHGAAMKVEQAFKALPATADSHVKDLLLDIYNDIKAIEHKEPNAD